MATKPAIIQHIEDQCGFALTRLENLSKPADAVRYQHNNSYHCDAQGVLRAINVSESENLRSVELTKECAGLQYLNLSENKNLAEVRFEVPLKHLIYLDLSECALELLDFPAGFDALEKAYLQKNQLKDFRFQGGCKALVLLDLSENQLAAFTPPAGFDELACLYLNGNQLVHLFLNERLDKLDTLHLSENKLISIRIHQKYPGLLSLYLEKNQLSALPDNLLESFPNLAFLTLKGTPIGNLPKEIYEKDGNILTDVRNMLISLSKGAVENHEVKMVLVGNSSVGKTTLMKYLQEGIFVEGEDTTHGIQVSKWKPEKEKGERTGLTVYAWDFGGQEYYHATHRLFLSNNAVYCLLWNQATNVQGLVDTIIHKNGKPEKHALDHYRYDYWLENIRLYAPTSPILLVQSKDQNTDPVENEVFEQYKIEPKKNYNVCIKSVAAGDGEKTDEFNIFRRQLLKRLKEAATAFRLGKFWVEIRDEIRRRALKGEYRWTWDAYAAFCQHIDPDMSDSELGTLTRYLTDIGVLLHYPDILNLKEVVFIKPTWVTDMIYAVFNEQVQEHHGEFDLEHVVQVLEANAVEAENKCLLAEELLDVMRAFQLIFSPKDKPDIFYAIQYLRDNYGNPAALERQKKNVVPVLGFKLQFPKFLPKSVFHRFIAEYGKCAVDDFWKYGIFFTHEASGTEVFAECKFSDKTIEVWLKEWEEHVLAELFHKFFQLSEENKDILVSANGTDFVSIESLEEARELGSLKIKATIGAAVDIELLNWCLSAKGERGMHLEGRLGMHKTLKTEKDRLLPMEDIRKLIGEARLKEAIDALLSSVPAYLRNDVLELQRRFNDLKREKMRGILSFEEANRESSKITEAALALCDMANQPPKDQPEAPDHPVAGNAKIYFSYAWGDPNEKDISRETIVNDLYNSLKTDGFQVLRDKMTIEYGGLISEFMDKIGKGDLIVVFVSDKYARSPYCMFELYEIARNNKWEKQLFASRILPVAVERIRFDDPEVLDAYFEHWEKEETKWANLIQKRLNQINEAQLERYNNTKAINQNFGNLSDWLTDMNAKTEAILRDNDFAEVKNAILARLNQLAEGK
ncbi:MAG: TIR domain-containing protein [Saprospiraceae bacterium]|nr:TIR domain-containing protein [Saprospiraceae bacterium]